MQKFHIIAETTQNGRRCQPAGEAGSTTVLPPGWRGHVLGLGDLMLKGR